MPDKNKDKKKDPVTAKKVETKTVTKRAPKPRPKRHNEQLLLTAQDLERLITMMQNGGPSNEAEKEHFLATLRLAVEQIR